MSPLSNYTVTVMMLRYRQNLYHWVLKILTVAHNLSHESYQVKEVEDFLSLLQLLPLDDVLSTQSLIFVTEDLPVDLHKLQKAPALGVKCCGLVKG